VTRRLLALIAVAAAAAFATTSASARQDDSGLLTVFAAASLTDVFPQINPNPRYFFAGSDQLATQLQFGAQGDVFAAASPKYPDLLYQKGLVEKPIPFVTNTLVLIVPKANPARIRTVDDLTRPGVKIVVGDSAVPIGSYTQTILKNLGMANAVNGNVVSRESDVRGILAKVALGEADAGFVYVTDARTVRGKVLAIALRESAQPHVVYEVAVVKGSKHLRAAHRFVTALIRPRAQAILVKAGFGRKPAAT
jgi:molybdate transport system substrate-binding protein